jgi:desulfoferrodoxin (superoxide reductase-like protein)
MGVYGVKTVKRLSAGIFISFLMVMVFSGTAFSHPPKNVALSLNGGVLTVNVSHSVDNPDKHYIYRIIIYRDNQIVASKEYTSQPSTDGMSDTFDIGASQPGSVIKAEAFCVIMGSASGSITVP